MSLKELQKTLPPGWRVWETIEGRILFEDIEMDMNSYMHPVPGFDKGLYSEVAEASIVRSSFKALSYTWGVEDDCTEVDVVEQGATSGGSRGSLLIRHNLDAALRQLCYID